MATVAKPFNSITQRFPVGKEVNETDDLSPHSFDDLVERGFIWDGEWHVNAGDEAAQVFPKHSE